MAGFGFCCLLYCLSSYLVMLGIFLITVCAHVAGHMTLELLPHLYCCTRHARSQIWTGAGTPLKGLWPMKKPILEQVHPQKDCSPWRIHAGTGAMGGCFCSRNTIAWSKRTRGGHCNLTCCYPWTELYKKCRRRNHWNKWRMNLIRNWASAVVTQPELALLLDNTTKHSSVISNHCNRQTPSCGLNKLNGLSWSRLSPIFSLSYGRGEWARTCLGVWLLAGFNPPHLLICYKIHLKKILLPGYGCHISLSKP